MGRMGVRLIAAATVMLCVAACLPGRASAEGGVGGQNIAQAPSVRLNATMHGALYDSAFYSGYSVSYFTASFTKGDKITIRTASRHGDSPPCQILFMPGTDDLNVSSTSPILNPASMIRSGTHDVQRMETATQTGTYVLAMTNADIYLSGPFQCLDAPSGTPFTFTVSVAHRGSGARSSKSGGGGDPAAPARAARASTHVVEPGQSLWGIAQELLGRPTDLAGIATEVDRLWRLNAGRIGTGDPDLIFAGQELRLK